MIVALIVLFYRHHTNEVLLDEGKKTTTKSLGHLHIDISARITGNPQYGPEN